MADDLFMAWYSTLEACESILEALWHQQTGERVQVHCGAWLYDRSWSGRA